MYKRNEEDSNSKPIEKEQSTQFNNILLPIAQKKKSPLNLQKKKNLFTTNGNELEKESHIRKNHGKYFLLG